MAALNIYAITAGTTEDFGLPNVGGQAVNVLHVPALPADTTIQLPVTASWSNTLSSYTVLMDLNSPGSSSGATRTLFANIGSQGQNGVAWEIDSQNLLHLTGTIDGARLDLVASAPVPSDAWTRIALVVDDPQDGVSVSLSMYEDGQLVGSATQPITTEPVDGLALETNNCPSCPPPPTLLSAASGLTGEIYASSVQLHAVALTPDTIAGFGSPDSGPIASSDTAGRPCAPADRLQSQRPRQPLLD